MNTIPNPRYDYFTTPITSLNEAHIFLTLLARDRLLFHPEDSPETIVDRQGLPLFTPEESKVLRQRIAEIYLFDSDPCVFCLELGENHKNTDGENKPCES